MPHAAIMPRPHPPLPVPLMPGPRHNPARSFDAPSRAPLVRAVSSGDDTASHVREEVEKVSACNHGGLFGKGAVALGGIVCAGGVMD